MRLVITDKHLDLYFSFLKNLKQKNNIKLIVLLTYTIDPELIQQFQKKSNAHIIVIYGAHNANPLSKHKIIYLKSHPTHGRMHAKALFAFTNLNFQFVVSTNNLTKQKRSINGYCLSKCFNKEPQIKSSKFKNDLIDFFSCFSDRIHFETNKVTKKIFNCSFINFIKSFNFTINDSKIKLIKSVPSICSKKQTGFLDVITKIEPCDKIIIQPTVIGNNLDQVLPSLVNLNKLKSSTLNILVPPLALESKLIQRRLLTTPKKYRKLFKKIDLKYMKKDLEPFVIHLKSIFGLKKNKIQFFALTSTNLSKGATGIFCCENNIVHLKKNFDKCYCSKNKCTKRFCTKNFELGILFNCSLQQSNQLKQILPFKIT